MPTAKVYIHGGDYDCSELVRMCYRAVNVLPYGSYMWTGNEEELLKQYGFVERSLDFPKTGDVLWRSGHTEIILIDGKQGGARIDEVGGITGPTQGDQTGKEITSSAYRKEQWKKLFRYEGGKEVSGIPAAIGAALVAGHIIEHPAHGYSQTHRAGDGTIEEIEITYTRDTAGASGEELKILPVTGEFYMSDNMNVRDAPSTKTGNIVARYSRGETVNIEGLVFPAEGSVWGVYTGANSGRKRYVSLNWAHLI